MLHGRKPKLILTGIAMMLSMTAAIFSLSTTWTSHSIRMHAGVANSVSLSLFEDCSCTARVTDIWWGSSQIVTPGSHHPGEVFYYGKDNSTKGNWEHATGSPLGVYGSYAHILPNPPINSTEVTVGNFSVPIGPFNYTVYGWTPNQISGLPFNRTEPNYWDEYVSLEPKINYTLTGTLYNMSGIGPIQYPVFEWAWDDFNSSDPRAAHFQTNVPGAGGPGTRMTCFDDGSERPLGPRDGYLNATLAFPDGLFMLSLYAYDKSFAGRPNQTIYMTDMTGNVLASAIMEDLEFDGGIYMQFVVCGPTTITVQVKKGPQSINAVLSGIFIDKFSTGVSQDQTYESPVYVKNTGSQGLYITYTPKSVTFHDGQSLFLIDCFVVEEGLPCQMTNVGPIQLPEKNPACPMQGFFLNPGKVIKVIIEFHVDSLVSGSSYDWSFMFEGATGDPVASGN